MSRSEDSMSSSSASKPKLKKLLILGPKLGDTRYLEELYREEGSLVVSNIKISDGKGISSCIREASINIFEAGGIDSNTKISIFAHGTVSSDRHMVNVFGERCNTSAIFGMVSRLSDGMPLNLNLYSCYAGAASSDIVMLPNGSTCVLHSGSDEEIMLFCAHRAIAEHMKSGSGRVLEDIFISAKNEPHCLTIASKLKDGTLSTVSLRPPREILYSQEEILRYVSDQWRVDLRDKFSAIPPELIPDSISPDHIPSSEKLSELFNGKTDEYTLSTIYVQRNTIALRGFLDSRKASDPDKLLDLLLKSDCERSFINEFMLYRPGFANYLTKGDPELSTEILSKSIKLGNLECVKEFIKHGVNINCCDSSGKSILALSAVYRKNEILRTLISKGAELDFRDASGKTALHQCARLGALDSVKILLDRGATIFDEDEEVIQRVKAIAERNDRTDLIESIRNAEQRREIGRLCLLAIRDANSSTAANSMESSADTPISRADLDRTPDRSVTLERPALTTLSSKIR